MLMKLIRVSIVLLVCMGVPCNSSRAQSSTPAPAQHGTQKRQGFFDYALDKVNPVDKDYGSTLQAYRESIVANTIDDLYFWSNVLSLLLLCVSAATILLQLRSAEKKEVIAASLIAELWNGRMSDRIELTRRTTQFNELVEAHNAEVEKALNLKAQSAEQARETAGNLTRGVQKLTRKSGASGGKEPTPEANGSSVRTPIVPEGSSSNSNETHLLLQRQLEATRSSEQNLKQRLNQTTLLLDQERRRNSALKGA